MNARLQSLSLDLHSLRAIYDDGHVTPVDVIREVLLRIASAENDAVWITLREAGEIIADAEQLGADKKHLPLFGVPFAVKDNIDVAGVPTTAACPSFAYVPQVSSPAVERLIAAGAVLIGKTNLDQFATGLVGVRSPYGVPRNPFDPTKIPGGSSSGSAVAVAAGLVGFALGTDTAGSGRVPAAFNNVVGIKPTRGAVSTAGVVPACRSLDCVSVFALTVEDGTLVADIMSGFDPEGMYSRSSPAGFTFSQQRPDGAFRFAVPRRDQLRFFGDVDAATAFDAALTQMSVLGGEPLEIDFAPWVEAGEILYGPWLAERIADLEPFISAHGDALHFATDAIFKKEQVGAASLFRAQHRLAVLKQQTNCVWNDVAFLLVPTTGTCWSLAEVEAEPLARNSDLGYYTTFTNLLDLAAVAVPSAITSKGFPVGVTLIGPAWHDGILAAYARDFHHAVDLPMGAIGHSLPPQDTLMSPQSFPSVDLVVFGAHLTGQPLNGDLVALGGRFRRACRTAPQYRMVLVQGQIKRPGLVRDSANGAAIEGEVWTLPTASMAPFLISIAPPLGLGRVVLDDGISVIGFICEAGADKTALDITHFGGWRAFQKSQ